MHGCGRWAGRASGVSNFCTLARVCAALHIGILFQPRIHSQRRQVLHVGERCGVCVLTRSRHRTMATSSELPQASDGPQTASMPRQRDPRWGRSVYALVTQTAQIHEFLSDSSFTSLCQATSPHFSFAPAYVSTSWGAERCVAGVDAAGDRGRLVTSG